MKREEIIGDEQLKSVFENTNFGDVTHRDVVKYSLLKIACGYGIGHTAECILQELGLIGMSGMKSGTMTKKGKQYLWSEFSNQYSF